MCFRFPARKGKHMKFYYGLEKKKFDENWEKIRKEYQEAGMDEESIEKMYEYDWDAFKRERVWCKHTQYLDGNYIDIDNQMQESSQDFNPLYRYVIKQLSYECSENDFKGEDAWIETLENKKLYDAILSLNSEQRHILKLRVIDELTMRQIADLYGIAIGSLEDRINVIFKKIKKFMN